MHKREYGTCMPKRTQRMTNMLQTRDFKDKHNPKLMANGRHMLTEGELKV